MAFDMGSASYFSEQLDDQQLPELQIPPLVVFETTKNQL
jgi:hypothetical protein